MTEQLDHDIGALLFFGALGFILLIIAYNKGFFRLPPTSKDSPVRFSHLLAGFLIYTLSSFLIGFVDLLFLRRGGESFESRIAFVGLMNLFNLALIFVLLYSLFFRLYPKVGAYIWRSHEGTYKQDLWQAFLTWIISFPTILSINILLDALVQLFFQIKDVPDQVAVEYVRYSLMSPKLFIVALVSTIILAPIVEEFIFRGLLQSFFRKYLGSKSAILLTAFAFALFHYSSSQGVSNISIIGSLFVFAIFLGFVYEKQRSLFASISLHAAFNLMSTLHLLSTTGS